MLRRKLITVAAVAGGLGLLTALAREAAPGLRPRGPDSAAEVEGRLRRIGLDLRERSSALRGRLQRALSSYHETLKEPRRCERLEGEALDEMRGALASLLESSAEEEHVSVHLQDLEVCRGSKARVREAARLELALSEARRCLAGDRCGLRPPLLAGRPAGRALELEPPDLVEEASRRLREGR
jgi:hypothetical protein